MSVYRFELSRALAAIALLVAASATAFSQQTSPSRVRGTIEGVEGDTLTVKSRGGDEMKLRVTGDLRVVGIVRIPLSEIKVGSYVGATTVPGLDGGQKAVEVHVFPEAMRGTAEGSQSSDLRPNSSMTNATVAQTVASNEGQVLTVKYKDGEKTFIVTPDTTIVTYVPGDKAELTAGARIIAFIKKLPDGSFETSRVSVGRDGLTPPM